MSKQSGNWQIVEKVKGSDRDKKKKSRKAKNLGTRSANNGAGGSDDQTADDASSAKIMEESLASVRLEETIDDGQHADDKAIKEKANADIQMLNEENAQTANPGGANLNIRESKMEEPPEKSPPGANPILSEETAVPSNSKAEAQSASTYRKNLANVFLHPIAEAKENPDVQVDDELNNTRFANAGGNRTLADVSSRPRSTVSNLPYSRFSRPGGRGVATNFRDSGPPHQSFSQPNARDSPSNPGGATFGLSDAPTTYYRRPDVIAANRYREHRTLGSKGLECFQCYTAGHVDIDCPNRCYMCGKTPYSKCRCDFKLIFLTRGDYKKAVQKAKAGQREAPFVLEGALIPRFDYYAQWKAHFVHVEILEKLNAVAEDIWMDKPEVIIFESTLRKSDSDSESDHEDKEDLHGAAQKHKGQNKDRVDYVQRIGICVKVASHAADVFLEASRTQCFRFFLSYTYNGQKLRSAWIGHISVYRDSEYVIARLNTDPWPEMVRALQGCDSGVLPPKNQWLTAPSYRIFFRRYYPKRPAELLHLSFERALRFYHLYSFSQHNVERTVDRNEIKSNVWTLPELSDIFYKKPEKDRKPLSRPKDDYIDDLQGARRISCFLDLETFLKTVNCPIILSENQKLILGVCIAEDGLHCIQGPPGAGKTLLLALLVLFFAIVKKERVLFSSFRNATCDMLALRILELFPAAAAFTVRKYAKYIPLDDVPVKLQNVCNLYNSYDMREMRIVIASTGYSTSFLSSRTFSPSRIILDEGSSVTFSEFFASNFRTESGRIADIQTERDFKGAVNMAKPASVSSIIISGDCMQIPASTLVNMSGQVSASDLSAVSKYLDVNMQSICLMALHKDRIHYLTEIYRSGPTLNDWMVSHFYGWMTDVRVEGVDKHGIFSVLATSQNSPFCKSPLVVLNVKSSSRKNGQKNMAAEKSDLSSLNEALELVRMLSVLCRQDPSWCDTRRVAVLSPYRRQIRTVLHMFHSWRVDVNKIECLTADEAIGREWDVVFLTLGRADKKFGFLRNHYDLIRAKNVNGRVCNALSRAKMGMVVLGDIDQFMAAAKDGALKDDLNHEALTSFLKWARDHGLVVNV